MATWAKTGLCRNEDRYVANQRSARGATAERAILAVIMIRVAVIMPMRQACIGKGFVRLIMVILMM